MKLLVKQLLKPLNQIVRNHHLVLLILISILWSCSEDEDSKPTLATASSDQIVIVPFFIADDKGNTPIDPDALLFERRGQKTYYGP